MGSRGDWRDGFLFLGNHLSLDFLNTRPVMDGAPLELLADPAALRRWFTAAGLATIGGPVDIADLREFREELREVVIGLENGDPPPRMFVAKLNARLSRHPFYDRVGDGERVRIYPSAVAAIFDACAYLLVTVDVSRLHRCDGCVLHFLDTSKKGQRRWCSMKMCGNRSKVAAYTKRRRAE